MSQHLSQRLVSLHSSSELIKRMRRIKLNLGFSGSQFSFAQRLVAADRKRAGSSRSGGSGILSVPEKIYANELQSLTPESDSMKMR